MTTTPEREATINSGPLLPIGDAAKLTGVSPSLLRLWERERLVSPQRTAGGHRLYSPADIQRLRRIAHLRRVDRLNAAAIRQVLGPPKVPDAGTTETASDLHFGRRLRALRTSKGLSLTAVAEQVNLSVSFLSAVELGQTSISVGNLFKLADAYGTTVPGLSAGREPEARILMRPEERPRHVTQNGSVIIEDLIASAGTLEAQQIEIAPHGGAEEAYAHPGEEFVYVLSGEVVFWLDGAEEYRLTAGDSLFFQSTRPHRWWNHSSGPATLLWINVPVVRLEDDVPAGRGGAGHRGASEHLP